MQRPRSKTTMRRQIAPYAQPSNPPSFAFEGQKGL